MKSKAEEYRMHAASCVRLAARTNDPAGKANLVAMAGSWLRLSELAEQNSKTDIVYRTPPSTTGAQPEQQQQEAQPKRIRTHRS
jgi:hypothetical protein